MTLPFYELDFGADGQALTPSQTEHLLAESKRLNVTDLIFLAHGFRCGPDDATRLYTALLLNLTPHLAGMTNRTFAIGGVYWPSQKFPESRSDSLDTLRGYAPDAMDRAESLLDATTNSRNAQDQFVASVLSGFDNGGSDPTEGLPLLHQYSGSDLLDKLQPAPASDSIPFARPILRGIDTFLNFMTWTAMKSLSGKVGENGLAESVLTAQRELGTVRIHLVGHSLGGRLMTACCKALGHQGAGQIDSLSLLEAAFSHFGFSPDAGSGQPGFFREVIESHTVRGPMISTFSKQDSVVGTAYAVASRLAHDSLQAIGDSCDPYGGIGHNGAQRTRESAVMEMHKADSPYRFNSGIVTCLDGSGGLITGHGDVTNPDVTYAIASAIGALSPS